MLSVCETITDSFEALAQHGDLELCLQPPMQDEMNEIRERESELEAAGKVAAEHKAHDARLHEANMDVRPPDCRTHMASFAIMYMRCDDSMDVDVGVEARYPDGASL